MIREDSVLETMREDIIAADISEVTKKKLLKNLIRLENEKINIMITGATGCGKSSTINALFDTNVAKVGIGVDPETMEIEKYDLDNLVLWDSPGLGDGKEADNKHSKNIIKKLTECDSSGKALIDLVLVILDGSSRDMGTSYELINQVIIPNLGENRKDRILVAINQCDVAMKGRYWNHEENRPEPQLEAFLEEKVKSVRKRIKEGTGVDVEPIYYCAGYTDGEIKQVPYNLTKLLYYIIKSTPKEKRLVYADHINKSDDMWKDNDDLKDYSTEIKKSFFGTIKDSVVAGADLGGDIGEIFGSTGRAVGKLVGGVIGGVVGLAKGIFSKW